MIFVGVVSSENRGYHEQLGVKIKGSPMNIWGLRLKSEVSDKNLGSAMRSLGSPIHIRGSPKCEVSAERGLHIVLR